MDGLYDTHAAAAGPALSSEAELVAMMDRSVRDVAAGLTVPLADVVAELDAIADRMEARRHARRA